MRLPRRQFKSSRGGFTLVEMMVSLVLLSSLMGVLITTTTTAMRSSRGSTEQLLVESKGLRALHAITRELRLAGVDTLDLASDPNVTASGLQFQVIESVSGGKVVWSAPLRVQWELAPGEIDDGLDQTGNGLVDDGQIVLIRNAGMATEIRKVLSSSVTQWLEGELPNGADDNLNGLVDETGLSFTRNGDVLTIRLTTRSVSREGEAFTYTSEGTIRLRN